MRFSKVNIEIANICNLQCSFCPEVVRQKAMMDLGLFRHIIEQVAPITDQVCFHLMGDPLVNPRLGEYANICEESGVPVFLVTNGTLLRQKHAEILLRPIFRQICFSLHSFQDNFPDRDPTRYLEEIFQFTERAMEERPDLYINFRLWNLRTVQGTGQQNQDLIRRVEQRFGVVIRSERDVRLQKSQRLRGRLYVHFDTEFVWPSMDLPVLGQEGRCHALSSHFGILVDGTVVPCCLDQHGAIPLGHASDRGLREILSSPRARAMTEGFQLRKLVEPLCQRCPYIERFSQSARRGAVAPSTLTASTITNLA